MKPFDLDKCRAGDPICTREGKDAKFVSYEPMALGRRLVAMVDSTLKTFFDDGSFHSERENPYDLFMKPKKTTWWFACWGDEHSNTRETTRLYMSKEEVINAMGGWTVYKIAKTEIEE